jgi:hypothetical protein
MKQYEFQIIKDKTGQRHTVFATAKTSAIARNQIANAYNGYTVGSAPIAEYKAHQVYGEIDCSMCNVDDVPVAN